MARRTKSVPVPAPDTLTDPVDWARHYWEKQNLDGDEQRFLAMSSLLRFQRVLVDTVEPELRVLGLNITDYLLLMTLHLSATVPRLTSTLPPTLMVHATTPTPA